MIMTTKGIADDDVDENARLIMTIMKIKAITNHDDTKS